MPVYLGTTNITNIRVGTAAATKVYLGTSQVWPAAAAVYPTVAATSTEIGTSMATQVITMPAGIVAGNLLIAFCSHDGSTAMTASAGWTELAKVSIATPNHSHAVFAKVAAGGDTLTVTGAAQDYCAAVLRITGHGVTSVATDIKKATASAAAGTLSDPPSLDAGSVKKWLWLASCAVDYITTTASITAMPSGYTQQVNLISDTTTSTNSGLGVGSKEAETQTDNPGTFTHTSRPWIAFTLAVPGGTA